MFYHYLISFIGALGGLMLTVLVQCEIINRSKKFKAGFKEAFQFYTKQEQGGLIIGFSVIMLFLFLIPWFINSDQKWIDNFIVNLRPYSIFVGIASQAIGFLVVKKAHEKLNDNE